MGEVEKFIKDGIEKNKEKTRQRAEIMAVIMNAPFMYKKEDESPWTAEDLIQNSDNEPEDEDLYLLAQARISEAKAQRMG